MDTEREKDALFPLVNHVDNFLYSFFSDSEIYTNNQEI